MTRTIDARATLSYTGSIVKFLSASMAVPLIVALIYGEDALAFAASMTIAVAIGAALERLDDEPALGPRDALAVVSLAWLMAAVVGAIPYVIAGYGTPSALAHPVNALFESMSGFTTTGATATAEISFERHSHAVLMWRQLTQWLGGMGIIVLMVAILPQLAVNGAQLMESEAPGPGLQKLTPRIVQTARALWLIYLGFTVALIVILALLGLTGYAPEMDLYNAIAHGFSTLPTGGFSPEAESIGAFSPVVQWAFVPFMVIAGVNFALFWYVLNDDPREMFENTEFRAYLGLVTAFAGILAVGLFYGGAPATAIGGVTEGVPENALRQGAFQIASLLNSTGFATADFAQWDTQTQFLLLFAMFIGGSAGSTGGGIKVIRWLILLKTLRRELYTTANPDVVRPVRLGGEVVDEDVIRGILVFTLLYFLVFALSAVFIELDTTRIGEGLTGIEAFAASLATIGNIGPGLGPLGPFGSYEFLPNTTKLLMIGLMWIGRLEIVPVLALFVAGVDER
ncbi:TrkH family potassium uptake protein [Halorubrum sp. GN11_10-6_MGM]|uniref:TrkH family potassium uptake protein n=1 Tax=Halorubrum sp. GN11_10-6_MGM TaxID=2518112 RepID=UPI0010F81A51|nr:TrkH family potassium uptake protein [Halorubrum sp. GN11_10-6_MGM]TKX74822.1 TrkH family potassium uptake protein [Halorubrum sp. GN11_10-6_MGM]